MNKHKAIIIPGRICENNANVFVTVNSWDTCKMEFADRLWFSHFDQPQSDFLFYIIYFDVYNIL